VYRFLLDSALHGVLPVGLLLFETVKLSIMGNQKASILPEVEWPTCSRCQSKIPQFQFSPALNERLLDLLARGRKTECVMAIRDESGCDMPTAKTWVAHHGLDCFQNPSCPRCGKPVRTRRAKQCRFCGHDWH
jgi:hypothetical protein